MSCCRFTKEKLELTAHARCRGNSAHLQQSNGILCNQQLGVVAPYLLHNGTKKESCSSRARHHACRGAAEVEGGQLTERQMTRAGTAVFSSDTNVRWASLLGSGTLVRAHCSVRDRSNYMFCFCPAA